MKAFIFLILLILPALPSLAADKSEEKRWWEKREGMEDLYFPHNEHFKAMKDEDPCMSCHIFTKNSVTDLKKLEALTIIANEPLEVICHECHVDSLKAPSECTLCHKKPDTIWPEDHRYNYIENHGNDSAIDETACKKCHMSNAFCTDCHFRRDSGKSRVHNPAYMGSHGIEARTSPGKCGKCHKGRYCDNCHRSIR
ncbi:MAG: hypothetical protein OEV42_02195 [Deltaproteobacteria bacterium]|nr:hypothetical protein [Deltaproteobacteria bacterium]